MRHRLGMLVLAVAVVAASASCGERDEVACTAMGCHSQVRLDGIDLGMVAGLEVCVGDDWCQRGAPSPDGSLSVAPPEDLVADGGELEVEVTLLLGDGETAGGGTTTLPLHENQPNGPDCEPICWVAAATVQPDGSLVEAQPDVEPVEAQ